MRPRRPSLKRWRPVLAWFLLTVGLNLLWEIGQISFYTLWQHANTVEITEAVVHCTFGDLAISIGTFVLVAVITGRREWPVARARGGRALALCLGLAYTAWSEWRNVYVLGSWSYGPDMPTIAGVGLLPMLQWVFVPLATWALLRALFYRDRNASGDKASI